MDNQRNLILAVVLCGLLLIGWDLAIQHFYPQGEDDVVTASERTDAPTNRAAQAEGVAGLGEAGAVPVADLARSLRASDRVRIDAPRLEGSVNPQGAMVDDVTLTDYRQTVEQDSDPIRLFAPAGTDIQQFARFGFLKNGRVATGPETQWEASGGPLAPGSPVVLTHTDEGGQQYRIDLSVDDQFMFTARQTIANRSGDAIVAQPFAAVQRTSRTASSDIWNIHSGPIGTFGGTVDYDQDYDDVAEVGEVVPQGSPEWLGFTDIYWLSALVPDDGAQAEGAFRSLGNELYRADLIYDPVTLAPGQEHSVTTYLFVGAKDSVVLDAYQDAGIAQFGLAIDWGWFRWFEKPLLWLLRQFEELVGNWGVAIILLTIAIRLVLFPIAQKQFASMASMRAVQPKMKALQERYKDDKQKLQQEMMKLYRDEKVNPLAGCLPILIQIPIFFALYKVLILAIEIRHEPFVWWIRDLSAPDPAHILSLFGLLPFTPPSFLAIGPLAVLLGITMWLTFRLNPTAMDPVQKQIFALMPWILMFVMAPFAAGLLLYWVTNNILTVAQQSYLYSKHPQLRAAAEKEKADKERAAAREKA